MEQQEQQPGKTGEQARHQQAEPDRAEAVVRAMPQAQVVQAVTVGSALVVVVAVAVSRVVLAVEVDAVKSL